MSYESIYRGKDLDISKTFDGFALFAVTEGKEQVIEITDITDMEVLYSMIGEIISKDYTASQITGPIDYDLEGC